MNALPLLQHLRQGPWLRELRGSFRVGLRFGRSWLIYGEAGAPGVRALTEADVPGLDATLEGAPGDLEAMLARQAPPGGVRLLLGERPIPPRRAQAHGLIIAAALGWAGPWPDPAASPEHRRLLRRAMLDMRVGVEEERLRLLPADAPISIDLRLRTEITGPRFSTEGAGDHGLPEIDLRLPPQAPPERAIRLIRAALRAWPAREFQMDGIWRLDPRPLLLAEGCGLLATLSAPPHPTG